MKRNIIELALFCFIIVSGWFFLNYQIDKKIRSHEVSVYLDNQDYIKSYIDKRSKYSSRDDRLITERKRLNDAQIFRFCFVYKSKICSAHKKI